MATAVETRTSDEFRRHLEDTGETGALLVRDTEAGAFDPTAEAAVTEEFQELADLTCSGPRAVTETMVQSSGGRYTSRDWYVYVLADELDGVVPKPGDQFAYAATGERFEVVGVEQVYQRAGYRLIAKSVERP